MGRIQVLLKSDILVLSVVAHWLEISHDYADIYKYQLHSGRCALHYSTLHVGMQQSQCEALKKSYRLIVNNLDLRTHPMILTYLLQECNLNYGWPNEL